MRLWTWVPVRHYSVSILVLHRKRNKRDSFIACFTHIFSADVFDIFLKRSSHHAVGLEYIGIWIERAYLLQKIEITVFKFRFSLICCRITHIVCSEIYNYNIRLVPFKIPLGFRNRDAISKLIIREAELVIVLRYCLLRNLVPVIRKAGNNSVAAHRNHTVVGVQCKSRFIRIRFCDIFCGCFEMMLLIRIVNSVSAGDRIAYKFHFQIFCGRRLYLFILRNHNGLYPEC